MTRINVYPKLWRVLWESLSSPIEIEAFPVNVAECLQEMAENGFIVFQDGVASRGREVPSAEVAG